MRPTSGLTFGGRYQLSSRIAIGGMGEVWQATDLVIGRTVAIKILKDEYLGDPGFLERFRAEARHAALVNHEGIANVFDYGEEDGSAYLVMELVPGEALSTVLERERVLSTDRVLDIVAQTASALHAAHAAGLVHRDIKPGNLLITPDGRVKITDFGIARIADQVPLTATGQVMGTVQYLSPEQASGHPASPTTDIYSLGIVAYEALAGRRPFTGESQVAIAMAQINEQAPELPVTVSEPVRNLVYACIAKSPAERPASAAHLARAAQALRRGDVEGAAAAVPGVAGDALTGLIGTDTSAATRVLPMAGATAPMPRVDAAVATEEKHRNPWTWPLVALVAVLLVALIAVIVALVFNPPTDPDPSGTPSSTESESPSTTPTETESNTVEISLADVEGMTEEAACAVLEEKELACTVEEGNFAPSPDDELKVYAISQRGTVAKGTVIKLTIYKTIPPATQPSAPTGPPGAVTAGDEITVSWQTYTGCPPGTNRTAYRLLVNGSPLSDAPIGKDTTSVTFTVPVDATSLSVTYYAECSGTPSPTSDAWTPTVFLPAPAGPPEGE